MRPGPFLFACIFSLALGGCQTDQAAVSASATVPVDETAGPPPVSQMPPATFTVQDPTDVQYYRSDEPLKLGIEHFNRGHFGVAAKYFEDAVTKAPKDAAAWIGLAASYDRVGRFDLADRAYKQAIKLVGVTAEILNNQGYSLMLRGRLIEAKRKLLLALEREPENPTIVNNLKLLNASTRYISREPVQ